MKFLMFCLAVLLLMGCFAGCQEAGPPSQIVATTLPVFQFTTALCNGTDLQVTQLVTENVSCLHDYTLQVSQMRAIESAKMIVQSGAGLESFLDMALTPDQVLVDASSGIALLEGGCNHHNDEDHEEHHHEHTLDAHVWLSPENAKQMAQNICTSLCTEYPQHKSTFKENLSTLEAELDTLQQYGTQTLADLACRELITFHDGFSYFAHAFGLTILQAVEEESGSEASAAEIIALVNLIDEHQLPAVFTERNGSTSAAQIISRESGAKVYSLDMAMSGSSYFEAMYHNIDTIKEALE